MLKVRQGYHGNPVITSKAHYLKKQRTEFVILKQCSPKHALRFSRFPASLVLVMHLLLEIRGGERNNTCALILVKLAVAEGLLWSSLLGFVWHSLDNIFTIARATHAFLRILRLPVCNPF
jgi:hypothetical protein